MEFVFLLAIGVTDLYKDFTRRVAIDTDISD